MQFLFVEVLSKRETSPDVLHRNPIRCRGGGAARNNSSLPQYSAGTNQRWSLNLDAARTLNFPKRYARARNDRFPLLYQKSVLSWTTLNKTDLPLRGLSHSARNRGDS